MGDRTKIEWTRDKDGNPGATWNPIRARNKKTGKVGWFCIKPTTGCANCYAETWNRARGNGLLYKPGHLKDVEIFLDEKMLNLPLQWQRPRLIFVCSMSDLFGEWVQTEFIDRVFATAAVTPHHTYIILTKRSSRMKQYIGGDFRTAQGRIWPHAVKMCGTLNDKTAVARAEAASTRLSNWPLPNVWAGVSTEDQETFNMRWPDLRDTPAVVRFLSMEPMIERINALPALRSGLLHQVITGGESGTDARWTPFPIFEDMRDQCASTDVPFFHKQHGEFLTFSSGYNGVRRVGDKVTVTVDGETYASDKIIVRPDGLMGVRVGKHKAGRMLAGVIHDGYPKHASAAI